MNQMFRKLSRTEKGWAIAGAVILILFPVVVRSPYILHIMILVLVFSMFGMSWNLCTGFTGIKTFGHQAFFGIGAYISALLAIHSGASPWLTIWVGGIAAAVFGIIVGLSVLRLRSIPHMAIMTMGMAEVVRIMLTNFDGITGGVEGLDGIPTFNSFRLPLIGDVIFNAAKRVPYYALILLIFFGVVILYWKIMQSKLGLGFIMIREDQDAAEAVGLNLTRYKLASFAISAFVTGVIGAFYGHYIRVLTPISAASLDLMTTVVAIVMVGGLGKFMGPIVGAFVLTFGIEYLRGFNSFQMIFYGGMIMLSVMFFPEGLATIGKTYQKIKNRINMRPAVGSDQAA